ncbi:MAG: CotH kinase family protein [Bacteroidota bacterium]
MKGILGGILLVLVQTGLFSQNSFYDPAHVTEIRISFFDNNWHHLLDSMFDAGSEERIMANMSIDGTPFDSVGVRYKGYSSVNPGLYKNPLNIDLDYTVSGQEYMGVNKIKLSNVIHDPTFIREVLSYEIARKYMPASEAGYAMVYAGDTLLGLYTNVQAVNKDFTEAHFWSRDHEFFKCNPDVLVYPYGSNSNLQYYAGDSSALYPYYDIESDSGWTGLYNLTDLLNNNTDNIAGILNVDRALWMLAFDYAVVNLDSYIGYSQNYYLYRDDNGRFNTIPWDLNMSFGSFRLSDGSYGALTGGITIPAAKNLNPLGIMTYAVSPRPLITKLMVYDRLKKMYLAHIRTIIEENFTSGDYMTRGLELQSVIDSFVQADTCKFYTYTHFTDNMYVTVGGSGGMLQYPGIEDLMTARTSYLMSYYGVPGNPLLTDATTIPAEPAPDTLVLFTVRAEGADSCFIGYRESTNQVFTLQPMFDDGLHGDGTSGDSIFGIEMAIGSNLQYYFWAENDSAGTFLPARAEYEFFTLPVQQTTPDIVINELMASNSSCCTDNYGEYDDWAELYNNSGVAVNLTGYYLSDDLSDKYKWAFPDTVIEPGSYLVIWTDNDTIQGPMHTGFRLSAAGESLILTQGNSIVDSISYPAQTQNVTYGRYPNGYGSFQYLTPTIGDENHPLSVEKTKDQKGLKIYPNPADAYLVVEIYGFDEPASIEIYDLLCRKIISQYTGSDKNVVDIAGLPAGVYILKFHNFSEKFIVR